MVRSFELGFARLLTAVMSEPQRKRRRVINGSEEETTKENSTSSDEMTSVASKLRVVLVLCGSMNPVTNLHLRMFGKWSAGTAPFSV